MVHEFFMSRLRVTGEETVVIVLFPSFKFAMATPNGAIVCVYTSVIVHVYVSCVCVWV